MTIPLITGAQSVADLNASVNSLINQINNAFATGNTNSFVNSQGFPILQNAVTQAFTNNQPLLIDNARTTTTTNIGAITVMPGSSIISNIGIDNPTVAMILSNLNMDGLTINATNQGTALQMNSNGSNNNIVTNCHITGNSYGVLHNDALSDGLIFNSNYVDSAADAFELNHPTNLGQNVVAVGNVLQSRSFSASAGFPIGVARISSFVIANNVLKTAANTAIHVEDFNNGGIILGISGLQCQRNGFTIQVPILAKGTPGPMTTGFMSLKNSSGNKTGFVGVNCINDGNGGVTQFTSIGNVLDTWDTGIVVSDRQDGLYEGNIIANCNLAQFIIKHGRSYGIVSCSNTPALFQGQAGAIAEGFSSTTAITSVISKSGTNFPGPAISERPQVSIPVAITHTGSGQQTFTVMALPSGSKFLAKLKMVIEGFPNGLFYENLYTWDGTTLTKIYGYNSAGDTLTALGIDAPSPGGSISGEAFTVSGGNLLFGFTATATVTQTARFELTGTILQNT